MRYLRELLALQVLCDSRLKVLRVAFIQAVNLASFLDPHVPLDQYELTNRLRSVKKRHLHQISLKNFYGICRAFKKKH